MKKIILLLIISILYCQTIISEEDIARHISHIELFSISWHSHPTALFSIQDANGVLISLKYSNNSKKYIVKNEKRENFENSLYTTSAFCNVISDSLFCDGISNSLDDFEFKDIDISKYPCRTLCLAIYSDSTVKYVSFFYDEMIINGHQLKRDNSLLKLFFPYLPEYYVKSIKYYVDRTEEGLE